MSKNDGGPAYPTLDGRDGPNGPEYFSHDGMSLRDYFAGQIAVGLSSGPDSLHFGTIGKPHNPWPWITEQAYKAADAMLAARDTQEGGG